MSVPKSIPNHAPLEYRCSVKNNNRISLADLSWHVSSYYGYVISGIGVGGSKTHAEVVYNMGRSQCWIGILEP